MAQKIFLSSFKGGVGVTSCAVGLACALAASGERVLLIDGDSKASSALSLAGVGNLNVYTLSDAMNGACRVKQAIVQHPKLSNFYLLPTLGCNDENFRERAVKDVEGLFDYIICDKAARGVCNRALVVTEPYPISVKGADICLNELKDGGIKNADIIVNKVNGGLVFDGAIMTPQEIAALLRTSLLAVIPEDLTMPLGKMKKTTERAFKTAAAALQGKSEKVTNVTVNYIGLGGAIKRKMRGII